MQGLVVVGPDFAVLAFNMADRGAFRVAAGKVEIGRDSEVFSKYGLM